MTWAHLEITTGILSKPARIYCAGMVRLDFSDIGKLLYFVEIVEADGSRIGVYDGPSHAAAVAEARKLAHGEDLPIHDLSTEGA